MKYAIDVASTSDVHYFAENLPEDFLLCRELGHNWRPHTASIAKGYYERVLKCPRCKCEREEQISMSGIVLRRNMHYPEGYLATNMGRIVGEGRGQLRLASITRQVAKADGSARVLPIKGRRAATAPRRRAVRASA